MVVREMANRLISRDVKYDIVNVTVQIAGPSKESL